MQLSRDRSASQALESDRAFRYHGPMMTRYDKLSCDEIRGTIRLLHTRISERFPESGLANVCRSLMDVASETASIIHAIEKPLYFWRIGIALLVLAVVSITVISMTSIHVQSEAMSLSDLVQMAEAAISGLLVIGAGLLSLFSVEIRKKRNRVIAAVNRLRCLAHIIDAHQLTKDPYGTVSIGQRTPHSPARNLTPFELGRYLDYCSEMLSLTSKLAFLYIQNFPDPMANEAVNDLENLITGLSRNIWQKLVILEMQSRPA